MFFPELSPTGCSRGSSDDLFLGGGCLVQDLVSGFLTLGFHPSLRNIRASWELFNGSTSRSLLASSCIAAWAASGKAFSLVAASVGSSEKSLGWGPAQLSPSQFLVMVGSLRMTMAGVSSLFR